LEMDDYGDGDIGIKSKEKREWNIRTTVKN
jgi:hypothetical protein